MQAELKFVLKLLEVIRQMLLLIPEDTRTDKTKEAIQALTDLRTAVEGIEV